MISEEPMNSKISTPRALLAAIAAGLLLVALAGCGALGTERAAAAADLGEAREALSRGDHRAAVELLAARLDGQAEAAVLLAEARAGLARSLVAGAPDDPAALRAALDQIVLALPLAATEPALHAELLATRATLIERLSAGDLGGVAQAAPPEAPAAPTSPATPAAPARRDSGAGRQQPAPPATTARPALYSVAARRSHDGSGNSGAFASCVDVQVVGAEGPVAGAVIGVNNGDYSFEAQSDAGGYAGFCGLGASTWSVVLFWTPADGKVERAVTTVYVSGAPDQRASAVFQRAQ
jgi:hypothetical protein